uniref:Uncharacterized protein n=1 Tax=Mastacembelus armatus TaxID=205130 RepID=A0A7N8X3K9_9TELE
MEPIEDSRFDRMDVFQLRWELRRTKKNEQWLLDENSKMQKQLSELSVAEMILRQEQSEIHEPKNQAEEYELQIAKLQNELDTARTDLRLEEEKRALSVSVSEQRLLDLEKQCQELEQKYSLEKMQRENTEKELETSNLTKEENKNLTLLVQQMDDKVQELEMLKKDYLNQIEELKDQLKWSEAKIDSRNQVIIEMKKEAQNFQIEEAQLKMCQRKLKSMEEIAERRANENYNYKKQANADKIKIYKLTQETATLTKKNKNLVILQTTAERELAKTQEYTNSLIKELEIRKKEAEKQIDLVVAMERQINKYNALKRSVKHSQELEERERKIRKQELVQMTNSLSKSQQNYRMQEIQKEAAITERKLCAQNLFMAQIKITKMAETIEQLKAKLHSEHCDFNAKDTELVKITKKYDSVKKQLQAATIKLKQTKEALDQHLASADKQKLLVEKELSRIEEDNRKLDKEVGHYNHVVAHLQQKLNIQETAKIMQEKTLKNMEEEVISLKQHIKNLNNELSIRHVALVRHKSRRQTTRDKTKKNLYPRLEMIKDQLRQYQLYGRKKLQDMKDREAQDLKQMQKYSETLQKLQRCQRQNSSLIKKSMASQGLLVAYKENYMHLQEENEKLKDELKKHKLECICKSRCTLLPPIPNKSHSELKKKEQSESGHMSGHTCLAPISTKSYCQSAAQTKVCRLPPISNEIIVSGKQICPRLPHL